MWINQLATAELFSEKHKKEKDWKNVLFFPYFCVFEMWRTELQFPPNWATTLNNKPHPLLCLSTYVNLSGVLDVEMSHHLPPRLLCYAFPEIAKSRIVELFPSIAPAPAAAPVVVGGRLLKTNACRAWLVPFSLDWRCIYLSQNSDAAQYLLYLSILK